MHMALFEELHCAHSLWKVRKGYTQQIVHSEDFVGSEVEVAGDVAFGEDVDGLGALGGGPDGAGEVIF